MNKIRFPFELGCLIVSENGREILEEFLSRTRYPLNLNSNPFIRRSSHRTFLFSLRYSNRQCRDEHS